MNIAELLDDIRKSLQNRVKNPLLGTFTISWALCNWDIFVLLSSSYDPEAKIQAIEKKLVFAKMLGYPAISTALLIFLIPFASHACLAATLKFQSNMRALRRKIEGNELISVEEANDLRKQIDKLTSEKKKGIHEREITIEKQRNTIDITTSENAALKGKVDLLNIVVAKVISDPTKPNENNLEIKAFRDRLETEAKKIEGEESFTVGYDVKWFKQLLPFWTKLEDIYNLDLSQTIKDQNTFEVTLRKKPDLEAIQADLQRGLAEIDRAYAN